MNLVLDDMAYHVMLCFPDNQHSLEKIACEANVFFLENDWRLADIAIIDTINYTNGGWEVYLTFANYKKSFQLIVRRLIRCYSERQPVQSRIICAGFLLTTKGGHLP